MRHLARATTVVAIMGAYALAGASAQPSAPIAGHATIVTCDHSTADPLLDPPSYN